MINYEITKVLPQQLRVQVRYTKDGSPDYWINFQITDFNESNLHEVAQGGAGKAEEFWQSIDQLPEEVTPEIMTGTAKPRLYANAPTHNRMTHNATFEWVESDDAITQTWTITEKTDEEKTESIAAWRAGASVTMRQARLALIQQGLLSNVDAVIAALPDGEREPAEIEWEYGNDVERLSPLVVSLMPALGMSDEEIDDLFVLAVTF